ncbi:uncharacterized protein [Triticum aestivum]|uniref:uncharacterized protein n=1 Tax=Triticum aestivum TaxID=4565 RepID=UPI001D01D28C|nr:uncharacterized protein LOC123153989 [Triticum aestivum]
MLGAIVVKPTKKWAIYKFLSVMSEQMQQICLYSMIAENGPSYIPVQGWGGMVSVGVLVQVAGARREERSSRRAHGDRAATTVASRDDRAKLEDHGYYCEVLKVMSLLECFPLETLHFQEYLNALHPRTMQAIYQKAEADFGEEYLPGVVCVAMTRRGRSDDLSGQRGKDARAAATICLGSGARTEEPGGGSCWWRAEEEEEDGLAAGLDEQQEEEEGPAADLDALPWRKTMRKTTI